MTDNYYSFDLETAELPVPGVAPDPRRGMGITCAAAAYPSGDVRLWWAGQAKGLPAMLQGYAGLDEADRWLAISDLLAAQETAPAPRMTQREAQDLFIDLGFTMKTPVTWNGSFDFHVIARESGFPNVPQFTKAHVDLMYVFTRVKAHRLGLAKAAAAVGAKKGAGSVQDGASAPEVWASGRFADALLYVAQDALATQAVAKHVFDYGGFAWKSDKGNRNEFALPFSVTSPEELTVERVMAWPDPVAPSWMREPLTGNEAWMWFDEIAKAA
jgi:hypothetical protein